LSNLINPSNSNNAFDDILVGNLEIASDEFANLNENKKNCIQSLQQLVRNEISLSLSLDDFRNYFKSKQECTASSPSGQHIGHYKAALECI